MADNAVRWALGYMNVSSYDPKGVGAVGTIFLFPRNDTYCFWMKNTRLLLAIVWISGEAVTGLAGGVSLDEKPMCNYSHLLSAFLWLQLTSLFPAVMPRGWRLQDLRR
jgi:uncharacterized membrane protein (UPF0127 family)